MHLNAPKCNIRQLFPRSWRGNHLKRTNLYCITFFLPLLPHRYVILNYCRFNQFYPLLLLQKITMQVRVFSLPHTLRVMHTRTQKSPRVNPIIAHDELPQEFTPVLPCFHFGSFELPLIAEQRVLQQFTAFPPFPAKRALRELLHRRLTCPPAVWSHYRREGIVQEKPGLYFLAENWLVVMSQRALLQLGFISLSYSVVLH